jgi:hypothetical protein
VSPEPRSKQRLLALARAAQLIASPETEWGRKARQLLCQQAGLSPQGVEYALWECLEAQVSRATLSQLMKRAPQAKTVHVVLSANVFTAAFRAIALGLAQSDEVRVRPSSREPTFARLLFEAAPGAFELVEEVAPKPGDHVWIYGTHESIEAISDTFPPGVAVHGHGPGMGAAVVRQPDQWTRSVLRDGADRLAQDVVAFDQRGCLSPRVVLVQGGDDFFEQFVDELHRALAGWQSAVPRGALSESEGADAERYQQTMGYVARCLDLEPGLIAIDPVWERLVVPPVGRHLHVTRTVDPLARLIELAPHLTTVGFFHAGSLVGQCQAQIGPRRYVDLGQMQRPALDGPVDLRSGWDFHST